MLPSGGNHLLHRCILDQRFKGGRAWLVFRITASRLFLFCISAPVACLIAACCWGLAIRSALLHALSHGATQICFKSDSQEFIRAIKSTFQTGRPRKNPLRHRYSISFVYFLRLFVYSMLSKWACWLYSKGLLVLLRNCTIPLGSTSYSILMKLLFKKNYVYQCILHVKDILINFCCQYKFIFCFPSTSHFLTLHLFH